GQAGDNTENNAVVNLQYYTVSDSDGSTAQGTLNITFNDDMPSASDSALRSLDEGAFVEGDFSFVAGADGAGVTHINGQALSFGEDGYSQAIDTGHGSIQVTAAGHYIFTADASVNNTSGAVVDNLTFTVTDSDGDAVTANASFSINDANIPSAGITYATVDDDGLAAGNAASTTGDIDANAGEVPFSASEAVWNGTLIHNFGGDGAGSITFSTMDGTTGTVGQESVTYHWNAGTLTAVITSSIDASRVGQELFNVVVNPTSGDYTVTLEKNVLQLSLDGQAGDNTENNAVVNLQYYTVSDSDGSTAQGTLNITFNDDMPSVLDKTDLIYSNWSYSGTGIYDYSIGADTHSSPYSATNSDFASITLAGVVGSNAILNQSVTWDSESANTAVFKVAFDYASNPTTPSILTHETGSLTFDKVAGTYTVHLDHPIESYTVLSTAQGQSFIGYESGTSTVDSTHPAVMVTQLSSNFYVQFTGDTSSNSSPLISGDGNTGDSTYTSGELLSSGTSWVSVSNSANGVGGDTIGQKDILDFNFYSSDPKGYAISTPTAQANNMYLRFDGIGNTEDLVVNLKLYDTVAGTYTTKAVVIDNTDIYKHGDTLPSGYTNFVLDNNDGLVIIESNDYNSAGQHYVIVGAQVITTTDNLSGSGIDLNPAVGDSGASTGTEAFGALTSDTDVIKISDIGIVTATTSTQNANLQFNVSNVDADGDMTNTQTLHVTIDSDHIFTGTSADESIQGTSGSDLLSGGGGDDILVSDIHTNSGVLDTTTDHTFKGIDGGTGVDTLVLTSNNNIDFSALDNTNNPITNIEIIDLNVGNHQLQNISLQDVLDITGKSTDTTLTILGDSGDKVGLANSSEWNSPTQVSHEINGVSYNFNEYTSTTDSTVVLRVETDIQSI
ncbi:hypothetical protein, partial [Sulfuricurvum sp.]